MSRAFLESFFPFLMSHLRRRTPALFDALLPPDVADLCPEAVLRVGVRAWPTTEGASWFVSPNMDVDAGGVGSIVVRNPALAFWSAVGVVVGLDGARRFWRRYWCGRHDGRSIHRRGRGGSCSSPLYDDAQRRSVAEAMQAEAANYEFLCWSAAFLCFGLMNATALPLHCLLPPPSGGDKSYPVEYPTLWALDCFFKGACSCALVGAALMFAYEDAGARVAAGHRLVRLPLPVPPRRGQRQRASLYEPPRCDPGYVLPSFARLSVYMGSCSIGWFALPPGDGTLPLELWYLIPSLLAGIELTPHLLRSSQHSEGSPSMSKRRRGGVLLYFAGVALAAIGLAFDAVFCRYLAGMGAYPVDALMAPTLVFASCDFVFLGLGIWALMGDDRPCVGAAACRRAKKTE